ncbi:hypothetical protein AB0G15_22875 [Streptosporangium sp. NPDC023825]|uniref:hypothetical protein n=1 Tax=Streptosporangium sp. NPDC023825 TaxID=3154909 RepID=UPI00341D784A
MGKMIRSTLWSRVSLILAVMCAVIAVYLLVLMYQNWGGGALVLSLLLLKAVVGSLALLHVRDRLHELKTKEAAEEGPTS